MDEEDVAALADGIRAYVEEGSRHPEFRRALLGHLDADGKAALELFIEWLDPEDTGAKSPSHGG